MPSSCIVAPQATTFDSNATSDSAGRGIAEKIKCMTILHNPGTRVLVTGGAGFIGSWLIEALNFSGIDQIVVADFLGPSSMAYLRRLRPLNIYGYSKHLFDMYAARTGMLSQCVGTKYFNVRGGQAAYVRLGVESGHWHS